MLLLRPFAGWAQATLLPKPEIITARQGLPQAFVPAIVQDKRGFIWMATRDGLARYDGYTFKVFQPTADGSPSLSSPGLTNLTLAPDGYIWVQNDQFGLDGFDPVRETFSNLSRQPAYRRAFRRDTLLNVYPDSHRRLWLIFRRKGLASYDLNTHSISQYSAKNTLVTAIVEDGQRQLWRATTRGMDRFDPATGQFVHMGYPREGSVVLTDPIRQLYRRCDGELWLCSDRRMTRWNPQTGKTHSYTLTQQNEHAGWTHQITTDSQGIEYLNLGRQVFRFTKAQGLQPLTIPDQASRYVSLFVDRSDVLWMGTDLAGVQKINLRAAAFQTHPYRRSFVNDWLTNYAEIPATQLPTWPVGATAYNFRSAIDGQGKLWFAVGGTPLYRLDPQAHQLTAVAGPVPLRDYQLERPTLLAADPDGNVWLVHPDWTGYYTSVQNRWVRVTFSLKSIRSAMLQTVVDRQSVWIATASTGLYQVNRCSGLIRHYQQNYRDSTSLSSDNLYWLNADPLDTNRLWIGTFGSGLCQFDKRSGHCQRITTRQGLPNNVVYAAIPDQWGSVWLATNQGLGQLDRRTGRIRVYRQEDGLGADEFNRFHAVVMPESVRGGNGPAASRIVLGSITGLVGFNPRSIRADTFQPVVQLSDVLVNNRSLMDSLLKASPSDSIQPLTLSYNQNFITVRFAAMQYNRLGQALYRYRLGGLSPGWVVTQRPEAIFTALPPGTFQLQIQAANAAGQWSRHVRELTITIRSPWWQTGWAYLAYGVLLAAGIWAYIRFRTRQFQQRQRQLTHQQEAEQLRKLDDLKTRFFANLTHELRTPLTLILGPAQQLRTVVDEPAGQQWVNAIDRNAHRMLDLTNQLLDLSRLEAGVVPVTDQPGDLSAFVAQLVESVRPEAERTSLTLTLADELTHRLYRFDADKLERIGLNLLGNALKFTEQGRVAVRLRPLADTPGVELVVEDTGPGLTADERTHVFDRYYQVAPTALADRSASSPGSGIGLSLVKELVTLQGGMIWVESAGKRADGYTEAGARFVVQLPYRLVQAEDAGESLVKPQPDERTDAPPIDSEPDEQPLVLLVEDNAELRAFIRQSLPPAYRISEAEDGLTGWETALELGPDLIVSDVMMPGLNGFSLCRELKEDPRTSHIPVVLLTARTALDDRLQGLAGGADDYLTKPFHPTELQLRVRNRLAQQQQQRLWLQQQLTQPTDLRPEAQPALADQAADQTWSGRSADPFTNQLQTLLAQHVNDAKFGVEELAQAMGMSRVHLYRKVKAISGLTATELVRNHRLGQATRLLRNGHSVADTAEAVGFESPGYFAKCFRERYGQSPTDFQYNPGASPGM